MSIVQNPITGRTSGKFATAVFSKNFKKNTMRSMPIEVSNPKTDAQTSQRTAYKEILDCVSAINSAVALGMKGVQSKMSSFSYSMSKSLKNAISGNPGSRVVDLSKVVISQGQLNALKYFTRSYNVVSGVVTMNWNKGTASNNNFMDSRICFAAFEPSNGYAFVNTNIALLSDEEATVYLDSTKITNDTVMFVFPYADKSFIDIAKPRPKGFKAGTELATKVK